MDSAPKKKTQVLITKIGSYLGSKLAILFLDSDCQVFGVGSSQNLDSILENDNFTLLELNLAQPLPSYLPKFDLIIDLSLQKEEAQPLGSIPHIPPALTNLISYSKETEAKLLVLAPIRTDIIFYEYLTKGNKDENIKLVLIGDIYGEQMPLGKGEKHNELANLITQAVEEDKIILENEGLKIIYPTYISDALFAISKISFAPTKNVEIVTSDEGKTALSCAYEVQSQASFSLEKEQGLYFTDQKSDHFKVEPRLNIDLDFSPKVELTQGLKKTLDYFRDNPPKRHHHKVDRDITHSENISKKIEEVSNQKNDFISRKVDSASGKINIIKGIIPKKYKPKYILLAIVIIFIFTVAKTGLDIYLATSSISSAKTYAQSGNFKKAHIKSTNSAKSFQAVLNKLQILIFPMKLASSQVERHIILTMEASQKSAIALSYFAQAADILKEDMAKVLDKKGGSANLNLELPRAYLLSANTEANLAGELFRQANSKSQLITINGAQNAAHELAGLSLSAYELTGFLPDIIGTTEPKTYLILLQNNAELRPGGGFIGNFATVEFEEGKLKNISVEDVYTIDGQLKETIEPPAPLKEKLGVERFYLRDSNWSPDFEVNAQTARDFFKKETGKSVNGVITLDLSLMQNLIELIGPINLTDYNEEITAENLFERGEFHSEVGFFPGSTQKKDFFTSLTRQVLEKVIFSLADNEDTNQASSLLALLETAKEGLEQKHIMVTLDGEQISAFLTQKGFSPRLPPIGFNPADDSTETRDFLALVEANVGANKVNRQLERSINYEMTIGKDADLIAALTITYKNNSQAETWPTGKYVNYLRVYTPANIDLIEYTNGDETDTALVEKTNVANLSQLAVFVEVPIKSTRTVSFKYRIPKNIKLESAPLYHLYVQKQSGTEQDAFNFTFNLPAFLQTQSINGSEEKKGQQNLKEETTLLTDREFKVEVTSK